MIYKTIHKNDFHEEFKKFGRQDQFSIEALDALSDYLLEMSEDMEVNMKLDVIALCCEYSEYTIEDALKDYGYEDLEMLKESHIIIPVGETNRILIQN